MCHLTSFTQQINMNHASEQQHQPHTSNTNRTFGARQRAVDSDNNEEACNICGHRGPGHEMLILHRHDPFPPGVIILLLLTLQ